MADAVVDIRLIDQQKQNVELSETVERLTHELDCLRNAANDLYIELSKKSTLPDATDVLPETGRLLRELIRENAENVSRLASKEVELKDLVKLNEHLERDAMENVTKLTQKSEEMLRERQTHEEQLAWLQSKIQKTEESLATTKANLEQLNAVNEGRQAELEKVKRSLEFTVGERDDLQSKLSHSQTELKMTTEKLQQKSAEVIAAHEVKESLQSQLHELNAKMVSTEDTLKTTSERVDALLKEITDLADRLKQAEQLIVALNGEIMETQQDAKQKEQVIAQKQSIIGQSELVIAQLTDEKGQLEKDNFSLAHARAKAEEKINELRDQVAAQSNQLEQHHTESVRKLEMCAQERDDLKSKFGAAKDELVAFEKTMKVKCDEITQLQQDIALMGVKYATEMQDQNSKQDEALATIESLGTRIDELQSELMASRELQAASCDQLDILVTEKSALEERVKVADATINTLNEALATARRTVDSQQMKLSECEAENAHLAEKIQQLTNEKNKIENDIHRLNKLQSEAEAKMVALDAEIVKLVAEREELDKTIEKNKCEHAALNAKVQELTQASADANQRFINELKAAEDRIKELHEVSIYSSSRMVRL